MWIPLLLAEWLAGPFAWLAGRALSGNGLPGDDPLEVSLPFAGLMGWGVMALTWFMLVMTRAGFGSD